MSFGLTSRIFTTTSDYVVTIRAVVKKLKKIPHSNVCPIGNTVVICRQSSAHLLSMCFLHINRLYLHDYNVFSFKLAFASIKMLLNRISNASIVNAFNVGSFVKQYTTIVLLNATNNALMLSLKTINPGRLTNILIHDGTIRFRIWKCITFL